jgi:hypothetical protein
VRSLSCGGITDRFANPTHLGAEGTSVFKMGARHPTQVISSQVPASRLPALRVEALCEGCHPAAQGWCFVVWRVPFSGESNHSYPPQTHTKEQLRRYGFGHGAWWCRPVRQLSCDRAGKLDTAWHICSWLLSLRYRKRHCSLYTARN